VIDPYNNEKAKNNPEKTAKKEGFIRMVEDGYLKVLDGVTTMEEVLRVAET